MICYEVNGIQLHMYVNDNRGLLLTESSNAKNLLRRRIRWISWFNCFECIFYIYGNLLVTVLICMLINISGENVAIHSIDKFILSTVLNLKSEDGIWES